MIKDVIIDFPVSIYRRFPETGFEETIDDFLEADFCPGITSGLPVTRAKSQASSAAPKSRVVAAFT